MNTRIFFFMLLCLLTSVAKAVDYALPDLQGRMQSLEQYRGKWLVVNYWASWCRSCIKELPELNALHENMKSQDVVVIGINFENLDADVLQDFVQKMDIRYPVLRSDPVTHTPLGPVPALPTTYIIAPDGQPVAGQTGVIHREDIEAYLRKKAGTKNEA